MSKMGCPCGGVISDVLCPSDTEGFYITDRDHESFYSGISSQIQQFFDAVQSGQRNHWLKKHFHEDYPTDQADSEVVSDLVMEVESTLFRRMAECSDCGRIFLQVGEGLNQYESFAPDRSTYLKMLNARERRPPSIIGKVLRFLAEDDI